MRISLELICNLAGSGDREAEAVLVEWLECQSLYPEGEVHCHYLPDSNKYYLSPSLFLLLMKVSKHRKPTETLPGIPAQSL